MAPKPKKKTKEELEAEKLELEKEAKKLEEDRLKAEEEDRKRQIVEAKRRQELQEANLQKEQERLQTELSHIGPLLAEHRKAQAAHAAALHEAASWERYLKCVPLPHPKDAIAMNDYFSAMAAHAVESVPLSMQRMEDALYIVRELDSVCELAMQQGDDATVAVMEKQRATLHALIARLMDGMTAWFLHHSDYFVDGEGNVKHEQVWDSVKWGIWLNVNKNPRLKQVEYPGVDVHMDIQKQLALAPIAIRVQIRAYDEFFSQCQNDMMALGHCFEADLLSLPPSCKKTIKEWAIRTEGPLTHRLHKLPYPIPPAGADPATYKSEEVAPLGFRIPVPQDIVLQSGADVEVGMWDRSKSCWSKEGISDVAMTEDNMLTFKSTSLAPFSIIRSRCALLPYNAWCIRPCAGEGGDSVMLNVDVGIQDMPFEIQVIPGYVKLLSPMVTQLLAVLNVPLKPVQLLKKLSAQGLFLLPQDRDAQFVDMVPKDVEVERAMCKDIALLAGTHLISSSKWTQAVEACGMASTGISQSTFVSSLSAGFVQAVSMVAAIPCGITFGKADECICRISEVTDWEAGGRTQLSHLQTIFDDELEQGDSKVLVLMQRGLKGVALTKALNRCTQLPELPAYNDDRFGSCIWGETHASVLTLLNAEFDAELVDEVSIDITAKEEAEVKRRNLEAKRQVELEDYVKKGEKPPDELMVEVEVELPPRPLYWPTNWPQVAEGLRPHPDTMKLAHAVDPLLCETLAQLMFAMRLFSFSAA